MKLIPDPPRPKKAKGNTGMPVRHTPPLSKRKPTTFSDLPLEMRLTIYEIALETQTEARFIQFDPILKCENCRKHFVALHRIPTPLLHLNREARNLALKTTYKPFRYSPAQKTIYFAPEKDVISLRDSTFLYYSEFFHVIKLLKDVRNLDLGWDYFQLTPHTVKCLGDILARVPIRKLIIEGAGLKNNSLAHRMYEDAFRSGLSTAGEDDKANSVRVKLMDRTNYLTRLPCAYQPGGKKKACKEDYFKDKEARYLNEYGFLKNDGDIEMLDS